MSAGSPNRPQVLKVNQKRETIRITHTNSFI